MKQKMRDHIRTCGQVTGFLSHYHMLSKGEKAKSAEEIFTDYCLECEHGFQRYFSLPPNAQCHQLTCAGCERYQLFLEGWEMGKTQAELAFCHSRQLMAAKNGISWPRVQKLGITWPRILFV